MRHADLLVNVSGNVRAESLLERFETTAYVDVDPGYAQIWHETGTLPIPPHDVYFTIAENIGRPGCSVPTAGLEWRTTRPPVVLAEWPAVAGSGRRFTTVATWRGPYGRVEHDGMTYGLKLDEFRKFFPLPRRFGRGFELALDIHPDERPDLQALRDNGWRLVDPREVAGDADAFRRYVQGSGRGVLGRSGDLRRDGLRLVQRPHHPLPLLGEARARAGHGLQPRDPHRRGAPVLQDARGGRRRCRGDHVRLRPARQRRPGRRRGELRLDRILEKLLEDAFS